MQPFARLARVRLSRPLLLLSPSPRAAANLKSSIVPNSIASRTALARNSHLNVARIPKRLYTTKEDANAGAGSRIPSSANWQPYFPPGGEVISVVYSEEIEKQFSIVSANPGNRHLRYDLVTLCLRAIRAPLTEDYGKTSVLLSLSEQSLKELSTAKKFLEQLGAHLEKHITPVQRYDIKAKIAEHKEKLMKCQWMSLPLLAAYAHYQMLDAQISNAHATVLRTLDTVLSLYYFQLGLDMEQLPQHQDKAAIMYCRSIVKLPTNSASLTNLAVLEYYHDIDTTKASRIVDDELLKQKMPNKGYNVPAKKPYERNELFKRNRALDLLERAIACDADKQNFLAHYHLAFILETAMDDTARAREHYAKSLEINPDHMQSHSNLGSLLMSEKLYDKAQYHFEQAKILAPQELLVHINLANCLGYQGNVEAAVKEMQRTIRKQPTMPSVHYHLGMILVRAKQLKNAVFSFERALQLHATYPEHAFDPAPTYNMLIPILKQLAGKTISEGETVEDFEGAGKMLARCLDLLPEGSTQAPLLLANLSFCFLKSNRPQAALLALDEAEKLDPTFFEQYRELQQQDSHQVVLSQMEDHFNSLERTDAMITFLLGKSRSQDAGVVETSETLEPSTASSTPAPKKKKLKSSSKRKLSTKSKKKAPISAQSKDVPTEEASDVPSVEPQLHEMDDQEALMQEHMPTMEEEGHSGPLDYSIQEQLELLGQNKARLHYNLAFCLSYLGELDLARTHLRHAVEIDANCSSDYVVFGPSRDEISAAEVPETISIEEYAQDSLQEQDESATRKPVGAKLPKDGDVEPSEAIIEDLDVDEELHDYDAEDIEGASLPRRGMQEHRVEEEEIDEMVAEVDSMEDGKMELVGESKVDKRKNQKEVEVDKVKAYSKRGMERQLKQLLEPADGCPPSPETLNLVKVLGQLRDKYRDANLDDLDRELMKGSTSGTSAVRSDKSKRRKKFKYSVSASKRASLAGPNDGYNAPL